MENHLLTELLNCLANDLGKMLGASNSEGNYAN